eukprot:COSAG02_NODE_1670_length_11394_cov_4.791855_6_plen_85_part_00
MIPLMMQKDYKPLGWRTSQHQALCFVDNANLAVMLLIREHSVGSGPDHGHKTVARCRSCHAPHAVCPLLLFSFFFDCAPYYYSL